MAVQLRFQQPLAPAQPVHLRFGDELPPQLESNLRFTLQFPSPTFVAAFDYDAAVPRGPACHARGAWQQGRAAGSQATMQWQQPDQVAAWVRTGWRGAVAAGIEHRVPIGFLQPRARVVGLAWQDARRFGGQWRAAWQERTPRPADRRALWTDGRRLGGEMASAWQDRLRRPRPEARASWGEAARAGRQWASLHQQGAPLGAWWRGRWQDARRPPHGTRSVGPGEPPGERCYTPPPAHLVRLRFTARWFGDTTLRFRCAEVDFVPQYVIPLLRVYMSVHQLECVLLPGLETVRLFDVQLSTDADSYGWSLSASGPEELLDQLAPVAGAPARIRVSIDGIQWVLAVERVSRSRRFGQRRAQVSARSETMVLGAPFARPTQWTNASALLAQQLVAQALEFSGVSIEWDLTDWLVPAGAWSVDGTPLEAALSVAEAVGAVVQSHRTLPTLVFAPRYPVAPWDWATALPDVQMPLASVVSDSFERRDAPAYNRVVVSGTTQGVLGVATRQGSAGDLLAPMVSHALITHDDAVRQRAIAVLGAAGPQADVVFEAPVLTGALLPGVLSVGQLVEMVEPTSTWRGLVRGVSVRASIERVRQSVTLERHL